MIDVFFSDSAAGSYKASERWRKEKSSIYSISLMLDVGDIKSGVDSEYRKNLYTEMFWLSYPELHADNERMDEYFEGYIAQIQRLEEKMQTDEVIRIWSDRNPAGQCAYFFLCSLLEKYSKYENVYVVEMPTYINVNGQLVSYHSWGCLESQNMNDVTEYQRELFTNEIKINASIWKQKVDENSRMRVILNGELTSVGENFYDELILKHMGNAERGENAIIGEFLEKTNFGLSDLLIAWRIEEMIKSKRIRVVKEADSREKFRQRIIVRESVE